MYQNKIKRAYNKKIKPKQFEVGDLLLKENQAKTKAEKNEKPRKFEPNWVGPYVVTAKFGSGA